MLRLLFACLLFAGCDLSLGSSHSGDQDNDAVTSINTEVNEETLGENPLCLGIKTLDGPGGFLWKPLSESDGNLVILFPSEFVTKFLEVLAETLEGEFERGSFAGYGNPDRQTWRFTQPGDAYTGIVIVDTGMGECQWVVPTPSERQD